MEGVGIEHKEVGPKGLANEKQLLCVDAGLVEESLQGPFRHADALHQPFICVLLASQFATDQTADVDLHSGCYLRAWLPIPWMLPTATKKGGEPISSPSLRSWKLPLQGKTKMPASRRTFAFVIPGALFEIFHVSDWVGTNSKRYVIEYVFMLFLLCVLFCS